MRVHVDVSIVNDFISYEFNGCTTYMYIYVQLPFFFLVLLACLLTLSAICYDRMNEKHYLKFVCVRVIGWLVMMVICIHHHHCRH